jgi:hypothetical protein
VGSARDASTPAGRVPPAHELARWAGFARSESVAHVVGAPEAC